MIILEVVIIVFWHFQRDVLKKKDLGPLADRLNRIQKKMSRVRK